MNPADRYAARLQAAVLETPRAGEPRRMKELELQAHWFAGDFGRDFRTTAGDAVRIIQFGVWNREAGPDFAEAAISLNDGETLRGCIEIDPANRDWENHAHAQNPAYESVVLHVFTHAGSGEFFTRTASHRNVPQVLLDLGKMDQAALGFLPEARPGRCLAPLREFSEDKAKEILLGAAQFRLQRKAAALARLTECHGPDEALYQSLAATLGYKSNKLPFTLLAQRLPLRLMRKSPADALLFGVSGFLPSGALSDFDQPTRAYLRGLWEEWWPRRGAFERPAIASDLWKMSGQRPANHPQRRVAALAQMIRQWPRIRALSEDCEPKAIREFFDGIRDPYWDSHWTVTSKAASRRMALVGESRITDMLSNVFFPLAIARDEKRWIGFQNLRAPLANQRVEVAAQRLFGDSPRGPAFLKSAALQQGLLQIYEDFCLRDASDCMHCPFPEQIAKW
jgi:hypothetical protein